MKVKTTAESKRRRVRIAELRGIVNEGYVFEVTPERFEVLSGKNRYGAKFVVPVDEIEVPKEIPVVKPKIEVENIKPVTEEEPEIFVIEPGKEPVKVDKDLNPIIKKVEEEPVVEEAQKKKRGRKKKSSEEEQVND